MVGKNPLTQNKKIKLTRQRLEQFISNIVNDENGEQLKEPDEKGNTHTVWNNQTQEERAEKAKKNYCGRGKQVSYNAPAAKKEFAVNQQESEDDLPF